MSVFLQPLQTVTVGSGGVSSITFNNIPQTYTDLKVLMSVRSSFATGTDAFYMRVGVGGSMDGSSVYSNTRLYGNGSVAASDRYSGHTETFYYAAVPAGGVTSNTFSNAEIYISNYTSSNYKQIMLDNVSENNSASTNLELDLIAGLYRGTGAITNLQFNLFNGGNFVQYSTFALYGVLRQGI